MFCERGKVKVIHCANDGIFDVAGCEVSSVRASLVDAFNLRNYSNNPFDVLEFVNGEQVDRDYFLQENDVLEFVRQFGQKGGKPWGRDKLNADPADFYPTPPHAVRALLEQEKFGTEIWEPACGDGAISEVLRQEHYEVISTDKFDRGYGSVEDFLTSDRRVENIVTNPPYRLVEEFVTQALERTTNKVAMLLRLAFLESQQRYWSFNKTPLESVYVFSRRLAMYRGGIKKTGNNAVPYAWFVWTHGYEGAAKVIRLHPDVGLSDSSDSLG